MFRASRALLVVVGLCVIAPAAVADSERSRLSRIAIDKNAVQSTAVAGTTVNFTIAVTNAGRTPFVRYQLVDTACPNLTRTGENAKDRELNAGETWTYICAMSTQVGQTMVENEATATGKNAGAREAATATDAASIPLTQPVE